MKNNSSDVVVPVSVSKCPECEGSLIAQFMDVDCATGLPWASSLTLQCENEDFEDKDTWHRHWQSEWMPTICDVRKWLLKSKRAINY